MSPAIPRRPTLFDMIDAEATGNVSEIAVDAVFYFAASFRTTNTAICFILAFVLSHQPVYDKLRSELSALTTDMDGNISYNELEKTKYLVRFVTSISN